MTKLYVVDRPRQQGPRGPRRDAPAPELGDAPEPTPPAATKPPSFLAQVKAALHDLTHSWEEDAQRADGFTDELWKVVRPAVAQSYWNGVSAGASGRVKPKPSRVRGATDLA